MNRKQKKEKQLRARAHTKKQATVYLTADEEQKLYEWKAHSIDDLELEEISEECKRTRDIVKTALCLVQMFFIAFLVWRNW